MKRHGHLTEKVITEDNLLAAFHCVMKGKRKSRVVRYYHRNRDGILASIARDIENGNYAPKSYIEFNVVEGCKTRIIQSLPFRDRIALHAIMSVLDDLFRPMLIRDTYASITGRGIHDGLNRVRQSLRDKQGTRYCLKLDIRKFYASIDQELLIASLGRKIKDARMMDTLRRIIHSFPEGLPIGFHSSQQLGNFYLFPLDNYVKSELGVKYYFRYCDDIVVLSGSKAELWEIFGKIRDFIEGRLQLTVKNNYQVFPVEARGIDFLGYITRHDYVLMRKRIKKNAARKLARVKSKKRRTAIVGALWGWAKHGDCKTLLIKLIGMENFKDLGIGYKPKDGKKRFDVERIRLSDLQNCEVIVQDFETGVTTREGEDRCVVQIEHDGKQRKFITNSDEMKDNLVQAREMDALPFKTTIKRISFGDGKAKYTFN